MLPVNDNITNGWTAQFKGGAFAASCRVTVQKMKVTMINYDLEDMASTTLEGSGKFASMPFGQPSKPVELNNIQSCSWSRNLSSFCGEGQLVLTNTNSLAVGTLSDEDEFDQPGYYTFSRGDATGNRWGHTKNKRNGLLVPDRLIHIYQGYGTDYDLTPEEDCDPDDGHLVKVFTGLIDEVILNSDKSMTIRFRDLGRALMDTIYFPDVVPFPHWEQGFEMRHKVDGEPVTTNSTSGKWLHPKYDTDSNKPYIGKGFTDGGGRVYVQSNGGVNGHLGKHAFDSSNSSYYLSVGNHKSWSSAFEYVQGTFSSGNVSKVKIKAYGGPYTVYISLRKNDGETWHGSSKIPYKSRAVDTNADIKFVKRVRIGKGETKTITLPKLYSSTAVRVTFTDLWDSNIGNYQYRAGIADVQVFKSNTVSTTTTPQVFIGNIQDYTGVLAWILAWGGFFWPKDSTGFSYVTDTDGTRTNYLHDHIYVAYPNGQRQFKDGNWYYQNNGYRVLPHGRVWGDIQMTGTGPLVESPLNFSDFDKQPLADCLNRIKEVIGFNLFVDETGGVVWRLPNIYDKGNYISGANGGPNAGRTEDYITIDENDTLFGLATTVSGKNIRERVFVANYSGNYGATRPGYNPYPSGLRRYGGWTNTNFASLEEVTIMADLITQRQFMSYRTSTVTIAANPAIQIDDQVRIFEKVTSDSYFHYVQGINSEFDAASGKWTYTLNTSWLGSDPDVDQWIVNKEKMAAITRKYLKNLGF